MGKTNIEWAEHVWNPVVGCTKVSPGCKHCYAKTLHDMRHAAYLDGAEIPKQYEHPFEAVQMMHERLRIPLSVKKPTRYFVNSVSDLFHKDVDPDFIDAVFGVMALAHWHTFLVLTKRAEEMFAWGERHETTSECAAGAYLAAPEIARRHPLNMEAAKGLARRGWPLPNVWLGVSTENQKAADDRIPWLLRTPAKVRFLSVEPLLGPIEFSDVTKRVDAVEQLGKPALNGIDWVIVGGESGEGSRPMNADWAMDIRDQCAAAGVAYFFKQHGDWLSFDASYPGAHWEPSEGHVLFGIKTDGKMYSGSDIAIDPCDPNRIYARVGKKLAGRMLSGTEHNEFPKPKTAP